ncbi:MAG: DUF975 family protein [Bacteroidales bacterium]|nr:DUF975 family protein [Bacteroidales bacterium]
MQLNSELRAQARERLDGKWGTFVLMTFLMCVIQVLLQIPSYIGSLLEVLSPENAMASLSFSNISNILSLLALPLGWGLTVSLLRNHREESVDIENLFDGFRRGRYVRVFCALFLVNLFTFLWTLLLIIPGIMKAFSYALTPYILLDEPELTAKQAISRSCEIMQGRRWKLFCLYFSFIGWGILCLLTFGIGFLWLAPYINASIAAFYEDARAEYEAENSIEQ